MNILLFFVAGVTVGLAVDKLFRSCAENRKHKDDEETTIEEKVEAPKKALPKEKAKTTDEGDLSSDTTERRDDLSQLKGVGPKLAEALDEIGISNYEQLSSSSADELLVRLRETGGRFSMTSISSIIERAKVAAAEK